MLNATLAWVSSTPFGARGAGRIDDGHQVVGLDRTPGCLEVEVVPVALFEVGQLLDLQDVLDLPSDLPAASAMVPRNCSSHITTLFPAFSNR